MVGIIRKKILEVTQNPLLQDIIETVRGIGYRIVEEI